MSVDIIFRIAAIGIIIAVICQILKRSERDDIALLVSIAGLVVVLSMVVTVVAELFETVQRIFDLY
ncbi:MAG: stage III sporulation protein AC [Clostridia bacterium]|nr:stage III sporulation protein AC [Clostridia bacterium]